MTFSLKIVITASNQVHSIDMDISRQSTVLRLKEKLQTYFEVDLNFPNKRLIFQGKILNNTQMLEDAFKNCLDNNPKTLHFVTNSKFIKKEKQNEIEPLVSEAPINSFETVNTEVVTERSSLTEQSSPSLQDTTFNTNFEFSTNPGVYYRYVVIDNKPYLMPLQSSNNTQNIENHFNSNNNNNQNNNINRNQEGNSSIGREMLQNVTNYLTKMLWALAKTFFLLMLIPNDGSQSQSVICSVIAALYFTYSLGVLNFIGGFVIPRQTNNNNNQTQNVQNNSTTVSTPVCNNRFLEGVSSFVRSLI